MGSDQQTDGARLLMLDIETAPHRVWVWGLYGQDIAINQIEEPGYTLCWSAKWYGEKKIEYLSIQDGKRKMLRRIYDLVNEADAVIHYNGQKFDMPTLNQEFLAMGLTPPAPYKQIDLLGVARRQFRLPSNKMDYVARHFGLGKKFPHKGMDLWKGCMEGDEASWRTMKKYNVQDVKLLEDIYKLFLPWIKTHPNQGLYTNEIRPVCKNCGSGQLQSRGTHHTNTMTYRRFRCQKCGTWMRGKTTIMEGDKRAVVLV